MSVALIAGEQLLSTVAYANASMRPSSRKGSLLLNFRRCTLGLGAVERIETHPRRGGEGGVLCRIVSSDLLSTLL